MKKKLCVLVIAAVAMTGQLAATDRNELSAFFLALINNNKQGYSADQYKITTKNGVTTLKRKDEYNIEFVYLFDRKNWYMSYRVDTDVSTVTATVGMYFRNNGNPIVGVSIVRDQFGGPASQSTEIAFLDYACQAHKGETCAPREVTADLFPMLTPEYFAESDATAQAAFAERGGAKYVRYTIPRTGTAISAALWMFGLKDDSAALARDKKLLRFSECAVTWVKKKEKFELGKCTKKIGDANYYGS